MKIGIALCLGTSLLISCGPSSHKKRAPNQEDLPGITESADDWFNLDSNEGGINVNRVYAEERLDHEVIVAVIDSGLSYLHEDLYNHIWTNPKEIPGNGIDDDGNGYIDDVHGWNYLVARDGTNIVSETLEVTREMRRLTKLEQERDLTAEEAAYFTEVRTTFNKHKAASPNDRRYDLDWQQRSDDPEDFTPISSSHPAYGNNQITDVVSHGTHVSGIIAANRFNQTGVNGVADQARIMVLRAVPNGDELDKDIFHAVRYAVDQGARVINMSFGKDFSPYPEKVQEAFRYAYEHGVLLVHASGNAGYDMDKSIFFPSRAANEGLDFSEGWLEVGAVGRGNQSPMAGFSNYGKASVDIFAPGVDILSTVVANGYAAFSGTSMAAPVVSGAAALVLSEFPDLKANALRAMILETARKVNSQGQPLALQDKAIAGGVIDAHALIQKIKGTR